MSAAVRNNRIARTAACSVGRIRDCDDGDVGGCTVSSQAVVFVARMHLVVVNGNKDAVAAAVVRTADPANRIGRYRLPTSKTVARAIILSLEVCWSGTMRMMMMMRCVATFDSRRKKYGRLCCYLGDYLGSNV